MRAMLTMSVPMLIARREGRNRAAMALYCYMLRLPTCEDVRIGMSSGMKIQGYMGEV